MPPTHEVSEPFKLMKIIQKERERSMGALKKLVSRKDLERVPHSWLRASIFCSLGPDRAKYHQNT
jgi:hypothetical protein